MIVDLPQSARENLARFSGRTWLLPEISRWLGNEGERVLVLTGAPGSGKSMVAAWLSGAGTDPADGGARGQLEAIRRTVAAAHFCVFASGNTAPGTFARGMARQLATAIPLFAEALTASLPDVIHINVQQHAETVHGTVTGVRIDSLELREMDEQARFDRVFRQPLIELYRLGWSSPMLLIVDALDEAADGHRETNLARLLSRLTDLPAPVRFLVTTRSDPRILKLYRNAPAIDLIADCPPRVDDVHSYVFERLDGVDVSTRRELASRISSAAAGNFLYAHLIANEVLRAGRGLQDLARLQLPARLSGVYREFLNRELGADENRWFGTFKPVLGLIAVAQGLGLSRDRIRQILGDTDVEPTLRTCRQYLTGDLPDGPFRLFHKSFADFLLEDADNVDYHVDAAAMHKRIASHYLNQIDQTGARIDRYGLNHLVVHLAGAGEQARLLALLTESWMNARYAANDYTFEGFLDDVRLARQLVSRRAAADLPQLAKLYAMEHVVNEKAASFDAKELQALVWLGREAIAVSHARLEPRPYERFKKLCAIFQVLEAQQRGDDSLVDAMQRSAELIEDGNDRAFAQYDLLKILMRTARADRARILADVVIASAPTELYRGQMLAQLAIDAAQPCRELSDDLFARLWHLVDTSESRVAILLMLRETFAHAGRGDELMKALQGVRGTEPLFPLSGFVLEAMANAGHYEAAQSMMWHLSDRHDAAGVWGAIALGRHRAGDARAGDAFVNAEQSARAIEHDPAARVRALLRLASVSRQADGERARRYFDEALRLTIASVDLITKLDILESHAPLLIEAGLSDALLDAARQLAGESLASDVLKTIAAAFSTGGRPDRAREVAGLITDERTRAAALGEIAGSSPALAGELLTESLRLATSIREAHIRTMALREVALCMARVGDPRAGDTLETITRDSGPNRDLHAIGGVTGVVAAAAAAGEPDVSVAICDSLDETECDTKSASWERAISVATGDLPGLKRLASSAMQMYVGTRDSTVPEHYVTSFIVALIERGLVDEARQLSSTRKAGEPGATFRLHHLSMGEARAGRLDEARRTALAIEDSYGRSWALISLSNSFAAAGRVEEAAELVGQIPSGTSHIEGLCAVAIALTRSGSPRAADFLERARSAYERMSAGYERDCAAVHVARALGAAGRLSDVSALADTVADELKRAEALGEAGVAMVEHARSGEAVLFERAEATAYAIGNRNRREGALKQLVDICTRGRRLQAARRMVADMGSLDSFGDEIVRRLVVASAEAGDVDDAARIAPTPQMRATAFMVGQRPADALEATSPLGLGEFIETVASWAGSFERLRPRLSLDVLREIAEVAGWRDSRWRRIHDVLLATAPATDPTP